MSRKRRNTESSSLPGKLDVARTGLALAAGGAGYVPGDDPMRVFAAGSLTNPMSIEVEWRSGSRSRIDDVQANRVYQVDEASAQAAREKLRAP